MKWSNIQACHLLNTTVTASKKLRELLVKLAQNNILHIIQTSRYMNKHK